MSFLDEVRADRQPLAHVLKKHPGIRKIVEDHYPDRAHFIYELLQNAEDAGATEASFVLGKNSVNFEHNGRPFSEADVWGITDIGEGTKAGKEDKIGCFGVGFKAVFAYTETPHIWSPTFSFKISDLVLPWEITANPALGQKTRFEFPFNNPKKSAQAAYAEVESGLNELAETTLLFLLHLETIRWQIARKFPGRVWRIPRSENHVEVLKRAGGKTAASSHFLRFSHPVTGLKKQNVSVAFALGYIPAVAAFKDGKPLENQLKIVPANPGRVAVFFPAEKETSGLRFHLHAPFVPELSRASIKETPANESLFKQLAGLAAASLHRIRDMNLLTGEFLGVLPNPQDDMPERYQPIRSAIIEEMNNQLLTPTHSKSHAPAKHLLQAKASLKEMLSAADIEFLVDYEEAPPQWAISAPQKNSPVDRFLSGLAIKPWDTAEFLKRIEEKATVGSERKPDKGFMGWLAAKPVEWHQQMYELLRAELPRPAYQRKAEVERLKTLKIVRRSDGSYSVGSECFFPSDGIEHDEIFPRVAKGVYSSGTSKPQQEEARKFLEEIGVREVGEADQVRVVLKQRYTSGAGVANEEIYWNDLTRFIALVEKDPNNTTLFADFRIFKTARDDWRKPAEVFLDLPYLETGLRAYYQALGDKAPRAALARQYEQSGISAEKLQKFAEATGVQKQLEVVETSCCKNPEWHHLSSVSGNKTNPLNQDFTIPELDKLLAQPTIALSRLVWKTMCSLPKYPDCLKATYQKSHRGGFKQEASQLVHLLRNCAWVPQGDNAFVRPAEANKNLLPAGFPFDTGYEWLKAVRFGETELKRSDQHIQEQNLAKKWGFPDAATLERAQQFAALPQAEQERVLSEFQGKQRAELPEHESRNPERRAERVAQQAAEAPERITEARTRSVSVGLDAVKQEAREYLRSQYTNPDGEMICQVCQNDSPLPFKLDDGNYYFETVEFLIELKKRHYLNYLALCPNHSAMFQHVNGSRDSMKKRFVEMKGQQLAVVLAKGNATIHFTPKHIADLREVIKVEGAEDEGGAEDADEGRAP